MILGYVLNFFFFNQSSADLGCGALVSLSLSPLKNNTVKTKAPSAIVCKI